MAQKPAIPKGTRDFNASELAKRNYIFDTIKHQFQLFGFQPIETPSFEKSSTLMGKYGDEGDRLIFKILNSGYSIQKPVQDLTEKNIKRLLFFSELIHQFFKSKKDDSEFNEIIFINDFLENSPSKRYSKSNFNDFCKLIESKADIVIDFSNFLYSKKNISEKENLIREISILRFNEIKDFFLNNLSVDQTNTFYNKALRYDLTVPFARYVVQHQHELNFPFKRYQIQPVWRADRPQKGRFREFYQCDADVVGSNSLWQEVEFVKLYDAVFNQLKLKDCKIKLNNRKILSGLAEIIGESDKLVDFTVALDKLDKIGKDKVIEELLERGIDQQALEKLNPIFELQGDVQTKLNQIKTLLSSSDIGLKGVEELEFIVNQTRELDLKACQLDFDVTLARGLNYYTGAIFEVQAPEGIKMGSIGGGGRYDDLTGIFGLKDLSGVGISFGLDRIFLVMESLNLFPENLVKNERLLFINFGENEARHAIKLISILRNHGVAAELYPDADKMKKQMTYANKNEYQYVALLGGNEIQNKNLTLKNMISGEQEQIPQSDLVDVMTAKLKN